MDHRGISFEFPVNNTASFYQSPSSLATTNPNPSYESSFSQNPYQNPTFEETLIFDPSMEDVFVHPPIEDALSFLTLSPNANPYRQYRDVEPPAYIDMFGNNIPSNNDFYHIDMGGGVHRLPNELNRINPTYQQNIEPAIDYPRGTWYPEELFDQRLNRAGFLSAASQMNQGLDCSGHRRFNNSASVFDDQYRRLLNGAGGGMNRCGCGNSIDYPQLRTQSAFELYEQFRRGSSLSNTNRHRQPNHSRGNGNRSRRESTVGFNDGRRNLELSRSTLNNRNRMELQQFTGLPLRECRGLIVAWAQDQKGCHHLQTFFEQKKLEEIQIIFSEIKYHVGKLMMDPFGNYLVQKMFEVCTQEQLTQLIWSMTRNQYEFIQIAMDTHGNCCVQQLLPLIKTKEQISLVMSALGVGAVMMTKEPIGHHVLLLCLNIFTNDDIKYILEKVSENCVDIAADKSGCCILQKFVENTSGDYKEHLISKITPHSLLLAQDPYGNYVVQCILQQRIPHITDDILRRLKGNFVSLSIQQCSSNVVQKCLNESVEERYVEIIRELIDSPKILMLFRDKFANYVIQTALEVSKARHHIFNSIADLIWENYQSLRNDSFGKRVITRMNELSRRDHI